MPFSLYIHRADKSEDEISPVEFEQALNIYNSFPWKEDAAVWLTIPEETSEEYRPLFTLFDDAGCSLAITAYSDDLLAFAYEYPQMRSRFGFYATEQSKRIGTDQFPQAEITRLLAAFFEGDRDAIFSFVEHYPNSDT